MVLDTRRGSVALGVWRLADPKISLASFASLFLGAAFVGMLLLPLAGAPWAVYLGAIGLPSAWWAAHVTWRHPEDTARIIPAQAATLAAFVLYALGAGIGHVV